MAEHPRWQEARLKLHRILDNTGPPGTSASELLSSSFVWSQGLHVTFDSKDRENMALAASTMRQIPILKRNLTFKETHKDVQDLLVECFRKKTSYRKTFLRKKLDALWIQYTSNIRTWSFQIPIENMELEPRRVQRVGKVTFKTRGPAEVARHDAIIAENEAKAAAKGSPHPQWYTDHWREDIRAHQGMVHAYVTVRGTNDMAKRRALAETRRAIAALKAISSPNDDRLGRYCWILGEGPSSEYRRIFGQHDQKKLSLFPEHTLMSWKFKLDSERRGFLKASSFATLSRIVGNGNRNGFERIIDIGAQWLGNAMNIPVAIGRRDDYEHPERETLDRIENHLLVDRLSKLIVALEVMLNPDDNSGKANAVARRAAITVAREGKEDDVFDLIKGAYRTRNKAMHGGEVAITKPDVDHVAFATYHVLLYLLSRVRNYRKKRDWVQRLKTLDCTVQEHNPNWFGRA